ncbi:MAG: efflux RND transporter permease subunit [candidate division Zixibacteria bacterium]|nr:efflux RND transporter permease subunit [candidate division Zixibacteria bacterium]
MKLSEVAINRPVFTTMMMLALLVMGLFSWSELSVEMFPKVDFPFVTVTTIYPGGSAETIETDVSKKIEDAANQISGVRNVYSQSREGYSLVFCEFNLEKDGFEASNEVREKVAQIRANLPDDIEEPVVSQYDPESEPIMSVAISGRRSLRDITEFTKNKIKKRLETISGVGSVNLVGGSEREIQVRLNPYKMEALGITPQDVQFALAAANVEIPGGRISESSREYLVRLKGRLERVTQFNQVIVKNKEGVPILLHDIAVIADTTAEARSLSRYNGETAVSLTISKQSGANTVEMADQARSLLAELQREIPPDIKIKIVDDNSTFIKDSIHEIMFNIRFGMFLAIVVLFLFLLDIRPTLISGFSIPISLIATFTLMKILGFTINFMTLLGLSLAVGILIDDAIVVIENIYRHIALGEPPMKAAYKATQEIGLAVMATTFSIVVVFVPVAFMQGIIGRFFYQFGMSVAFAVVISLFVAFTLTPMLSARWLRHGGGKGHDDPAYVSRNPVMHLLGLWNRLFEAFKPTYVRLLTGALRTRWLVVLIAIISVALAVVVAQFVGKEFITESDQNRIVVSVDTPPGTTLDQTSDRIAQIEHTVRTLKEVTSTYVRIGGGNAPINSGSVLVGLVDKSERKLSAQQFMDSVRILVHDIPGAKISVGSGESHGGSSSKPVEISIQGEDRGEITRLTRQVQKIMSVVPGATDVDNTLEEGKPELQVTVDRKQADDLGLSLLTIPLTVRTMVEGEVVTRFKEGNEEYDVRMQLDEPFRQSADDIGRIRVLGNKELSDGSKLIVPLNQVAQIRKTTAIGQYNRLNRQPEARVNCNVLTGAFAGTVADQVLTESAKIQLPPGYRIGPIGTAQIMAESFSNIFKALILSVIFIYLLLASQYESFVDPLSIMLSLPLSLVGAILGLVGSSFSIMSLIGIVMLMGLVTKNAILLIDFVKQKRAEGMDRTEAILIAGPIRLRPILMTTFAMVFGMAPLALGLGPGAEFRAPMARAVIGGIISSTLLTLVVVPVVYTIIEDFFGLFKRKKTARHAGQGGPVGA